ncbi:MAG TPA: glycosyltransferase family 2 protein [Hyphomicrobiaceae bacterium]|jgi:dolichol-phosphate mannosyltransferase|nr:glycosyltransferase family 2 protein [Hyphomicrobiaceae bacterium]
MIASYNYRSLDFISVVAPVYNEEPETLAEFVRRTSDALRGITPRFELLLIDDGSRNDAWASISALALRFPYVRGIRFTRNFGQHTAISAGLDHAEGDMVIVMDSDLQDRPEVIPDLYAKAKQGHGVVFVNRQRRPEGPIYLLAARVFYYVLSLLAGQSYDRLQANYSIISREIVLAFRQVPDRDKFYGGTLRWLGYDIAAIDVEHGTRFGGRTSYNFRGRLRFAWRLIIGHSTRLLYLATALGFIMAVGSLIMGTLVIVDKLRYPDLPVAGWPSVITAVFFAAGMTNIMLGLVGAYLGELFNWSKGRPRYVIGQETPQSISPSTDLREIQRDRQDIVAQRN